MSHDLHFTVQQNGQPVQQTEVPMAGELDHLPDTSGQANYGDASSTEQTSCLQSMQQKLSQSKHPKVVIFHMLFKAAAFFMYIFGGWFLPSSSGSQSGAHFITLTVIIMLLLAADFWVVKNVTGRFLVGLRWWNKVENDTTTWIFESAEDYMNNPNSGGKTFEFTAFDRNVFWTVLYAAPVVWVGFLLLALLTFKFNWVLICIMALALSGSNVYGYYRCSKDQKVQLQQMMQTGAQQGAMAMMRSNMLSVLTGSNTSTASTSAGR